MVSAQDYLIDTSAYIKSIKFQDKVEKFSKIKNFIPFNRDNKFTSILSDTNI